MVTRGSFVHKPMVKFSGASRKCTFCAIFSKYRWFQTKWFTRLVEFIKLCKQNPLENFFIFTIYQNYTLALNHFFSTTLNKKPLITPCTLYDFWQEGQNLSLVSQYILNDFIVFHLFSEWIRLSLTIFYLKRVTFVNSIHGHNGELWDNDIIDSFWLFNVS